MRAAAVRLSPRAKPDHLDLIAWQRGLREQAGREAAFTVESIGGAPVFGEFRVGNPEKGTAYRVAIRGAAPGDNFCACPDFVGSGLGLCKHIAHVLQRLAATRAGRHALAAGCAPVFSELHLRYGRAPEPRLRLGHDAPAAVRRAAARAFAADGALRDEAAIPRLVAAAARAGHDLRFYDDAKAWFARRADDRARRAALARAHPRGAGDPMLARLVSGVRLHPYQRAGAWFLAERGRAILADDMGLGKTAQAIAAALLCERAGAARRVLVVTPASLKGQWQEETARFAARTPLVVGGTLEERARQWADGDAAWKIANYELLHRDLAAIRAWSPDLLILDEAQRIKNWPTQAAQAVRRLDAPLCFVLTGTPLENRLEELHAIVEVVDRHLLGPLFAFLDAHAEFDPGSNKVVGYRDLDRVALTLRPILLRRTRAEVLRELPGRTVQTRHIPLGPAQRALHEEAKDGVAILVRKWRRTRFLSEAERQRLMSLLQRMRMVCDDAYLVDPPRQAGGKLAEAMAILRDELTDPATKAVVFSTWLGMHELLGAELTAAGIGHAFLHGGVAANERPALVRRFRDDPACRVFLATDCGSTGLNLQCASVLIGMDLPWNPAVREQRIGRIHRQGQSRPVRVYDLVAPESIESHIAGLLGFKSGLAAGVLDGGATSVRLGDGAIARIATAVEALDRSAPAAAAVDAASPPAARVGEADPGVAAPAHADAAAALAGLGEVLGRLGALVAGARIEPDPATGAASLRMPLPDAAALAPLTRALADLQRLLGGAAGA